MMELDELNEFLASVKSAPQVKDTLLDRQQTHGNFEKQAYRSMQILAAMEESDNWAYLTPDQRESLILIAVKIGRILTGNRNEPDHWHDIAGYAQLVENRLNGRPSNGGAALGAQS